MASYSYRCSNCNRSFQSMKMTSKCIYCGSGSISSTSIDINPILTNMNSSKSSNNNLNSEKYIIECNSCHYKEQTSIINSSCSNCNSSSVKITKSEHDMEYTYRCSTCSNEFSVLGETSNCNRCFSSDISRKMSRSDMDYGISVANAGVESSPPITSNVGATTPGYTTNDSQNSSNLYDGSTTPVISGTTSSEDTENSSDKSSSGEKKKKKGFFESVKGIVNGIVENVSDFFSSFYTSEDDEKEYINSFLQTENPGSIYNGAIGAYDDGTNVEDEELAKNLQGMEDTSGTITDHVPMGNDIFGLPLYYNAYADPAKTVFNNTILYDAPLISIIPGKPKINRKFIDATGDKVLDLDEYYEKTTEGTESPDFHLGVLNPKNEGDLRYLSFKSNYSEYWKYVQFLTSYVHNWIFAKNSESWNFEVYNFDAKLKNKYSDNYGLLYYADRSSTFSETASNSYSTSRISEMVNEKSSTIREASMLGKYGSITDFTSSLSQNISSWMEGTMSSIESLKSFEGILSKTANSLMKVVNGAQLDFPEVWQDSKFDRSYSLSFRFYSPYGDRQSIEDNVFTPFLSLLALVLARQDQAFSYIEPFLVRVDAPGMFHVDCGVITSMTINKGGSDGLWTADGLPRLMEITIEIQDLYPMLKQLSKKSMVKYNKSLCTYLENLAGIRGEDIALSNLLNFKVNRWLSNSIITTWDERLSNALSDKLYSASDFIINLLK